MTACSLRIDAEQLAALQHLQPGPESALTCPSTTAVDRHLARAGEEPLLRPALDASPCEVVGFSDEVIRRSNAIGMNNQSAKER